MITVDLKEVLKKSYWKSFLISLVLKYNLEPTCVYSCKDVYSQKLNAVIVSLDESNLDLYNIIEPQG